jgi:hypothetical protein
MYLHREGRRKSKGERAKSEGQRGKGQSAKSKGSRTHSLLFGPCSLLFALDQSFPQGLSYGLRFGVDLEFVVDVLEMEGDCAHAYA